MNDTLRIDYSKYQVDELVETISDAIFFPLYIGKVVGKVVSLVSIALIAIAYFYTGGILTSIFFFLLAFIVSLPTIALLSVLQLINTVKKDLEKIYDITIDTSKKAYQDTLLLKKQSQSGLTKSITFTDVFKGISLFVIRPSLKKVLDRKIGFLSWPFTIIIDFIFKITIARKSPDTEEIVISETNGIKTNISQDQTIKPNKAEQVTLGIIKFPIKVVLFIYVPINILIVWLLTMLL